MGFYGVTFALHREC